MNGSTNVLAIAGDISLFGLRAVTDTFRRPFEVAQISRSGAMAVRQYVQQRFELDPKNLGVVPMNSTLPNGVERATWDGVCIVVLLAKFRM
jgi:hypothetical protein